MSKRRRATLIGFIGLIPVSLIIGFAYLQNRWGETVDIKALVQERTQFESGNPLESESLTAGNSTRRLTTLASRGRSYAATSTWEGKSVVIHGYWNGSFEGIAISSKPPGKTIELDDLVMMQPTPGFGDNQLSLARIMPSWFAGIVTARLVTEPVRVGHGDYIRVFGEYHATGYGGSGDILESCSWLELRKIDRWSHDQKRWQNVNQLW